MGNSLIKQTFSQDRFKLLVSKLYVNVPKKPALASQLYYIKKVIACLKYTFQKCQQDSVCQSIDKSMVKFKGRSLLKQYMPLKPVKRGIRMWMHCDSKTGYMYDMNVCGGREGPVAGRVVSKYFLHQ